MVKVQQQGRDKLGKKAVAEKLIIELFLIGIILIAVMYFLFSFFSKGPEYDAAEKVLSEIEASYGLGAKSHSFEVYIPYESYDIKRYDKRYYSIYVDGKNVFLFEEKTKDSGNYNTKASYPLSNYGFSVMPACIKPTQEKQNIEVYLEKTDKPGTKKIRLYKYDVASGKKSEFPSKC